MVVVDPPFITEEVWMLYARAVDLLMLNPDKKPAEAAPAVSAEAATSAAPVPAAAEGPSATAAAAASTAAATRLCGTEGKQGVLQRAAQEAAALPGAAGGEGGDGGEAKVYVAPSRGKVLVSSVAENGALFRRLFGAHGLKFRPSIPHLVYQYDLFANYETTKLNELNKEVDW